MSGKHCLGQTGANGIHSCSAAGSDSGEWNPEISIGLLATGVHGRDPARAPALVDSGSFMSLIPETLGREAGFEHTAGDIKHHYKTVGGRVPYYLRSATISFGDRKVKKVPVAWVQSDQIDPAIGRLGVFTRFDVEFSQTDQRINFYPNETYTTKILAHRSKMHHSGS